MGISEAAQELPSTAAPSRELRRADPDRWQRTSLVREPTFRTTYPEVEWWLETKAKYDPTGVFTSDFGRRVGYLETTSDRVASGNQGSVSLS